MSLCDTLKHDCCYWADEYNKSWRRTSELAAQDRRDKLSTIRELRAENAKLLDELGVQDAEIIVLKGEMYKLQAEIEHLKKYLNTANRTIPELLMDKDNLKAENAKLRGVVERLREALKASQSFLLAVVESLANQKVSPTLKLMAETNDHLATKALAESADVLGIGK